MFPDVTETVILVYEVTTQHGYSVFIRSGVHKFPPNLSP